jgi:hypothetical protein
MLGEYYYCTTWLRAIVVVGVTATVGQTAGLTINDDDNNRQWMTQLCTAPHYSIQWVALLLLLDGWQVRTVNTILSKVFATSQSTSTIYDNRLLIRNDLIFNTADI